jgi:hypothetical protein
VGLPQPSVLQLHGLMHRESEDIRPRVTNWVPIFGPKIYESRVTAFTRNFEATEGLR